MQRRAWESLKGAAKVQVWKVLSSTIAQPTFGGNLQDRGKVGYMLAVPRGEGRPMAVVPSIHPTAYYTGTNGSDHLRAPWAMWSSGGMRSVRPSWRSPNAPSVSS